MGWVKYSVRLENFISSGLQDQGTWVILNNFKFRQ